MFTAVLVKKMRYVTWPSFAHILIWRSVGMYISVIYLREKYVGACPKKIIFTSLRKMSVKKRPLPDTAVVKNWSARSSFSISICKLPPGLQGHDGRTPQELIHQVSPESKVVFRFWFSHASHFSFYYY